MFQERDKVSAGADTGFNISRQAIFTIIICVVISMFLIRTGFLAFVYLVPLGFAVIVTGSMWYTFIAAALTNIILDLGFNIINSSIGPANAWMDILYFSTLFLGFTWIIGGKNFRTLYRFFLASAAGTIAFLIVINRQESSFFAFFTAIANDLFPGLVTFELLETIKIILLRGGALFSMVLMFFVNRQLTVSAVRLIKKQKNTRGLIEFFAPANTIWILIGALGTIIITGMFKIEILDILAWNVFVICALIYMAQGAGIFMYLLSRRTHAFRLGINILVIVLLFSPLGTILVAALLLLGIVENWYSFRVIKNGAARG